MLFTGRSAHIVIRDSLGILDLLRGALLCSSPKRHLHLSHNRQRAELIDGKKVAAEIHKELAGEVQRLMKSKGRPPHLVLVRVGGDPASGSYVRNKTKAAEEIGIQSTVHHLPEDTNQSSLLTLVQELNSDDDVDGILVQNLTDKPVINNGIDTFGKNAVVCGRSKNVGMPIAMLLHGDGIRPDGKTGGLDATTTICHRYTPPKQLRFFVATADILVTAAGLPGLITGDMIKPGCVVIDVGINRIMDTSTGKPRLVGDCDFESCVEKAAYITPVPGGVGPMTVAMLMRNTILAAKRIVQY